MGSGMPERDMKKEMEEKSVMSTFESTYRNWCI